MSGPGDAGVVYEYTVPGGQYLFSVTPATVPSAPITAFGYEPDSGLLFYGFYETSFGQCQMYPIETSTPNWATNSSATFQGADALISGLAAADGNQSLYMSQFGGELWQCPSPQSLNGFCGLLAGNGGVQFAALASAELRGTFVPFLAAESASGSSTYKIDCYNTAAGLIPVSSQTFNSIATNGMTTGPADGGFTLFVSDGTQVWAAPACCGTDCATFTAVSGLDGVAPGALAVDPQGQTLYVADSNAQQMVAVPLAAATP